MCKIQVLFIITIPVAVFFIQEWLTIADDNWQLDDSAELSDAEEIEPVILFNRIPSMHVRCRVDISILRMLTKCDF